MNNRAGHQKGGSPISTIIVLALLGFGAYVALQYVPQFIEARSIQSILDSMQSSQGIDPVKTEAAAREKVTRMLQVNEMDDMTNAFKVTRRSDTIMIRFSYDRDLNLIYKIKPIHYEMSVRLN